MSSFAFLPPTSLPAHARSSTPHPTLSRRPARHAPLRMDSAPSPALYEKHFPAPDLFRAPKIIFGGTASLTVDMEEVPLPDSAGGAPDPGATPDPSLYPAFGPDRLNKAPRVSISAGGGLADSPAPSPALYGRYAGTDFLNAGPVIRIAEGSVSVAMEEAPLALAWDEMVGPPENWVPCGAMVGVEMEEVGLGEVESDAPAEENYSAYFPEARLNKAPVIEVSYLGKARLNEAVVKVGYETIDGSRVAAEAERDDEPRRSAYEAFDNEWLNKAPVISMERGETDEDSKVAVDMEDLASVTLHAAPFIEFDGSEGVSVSMKTVVGDADAVDRAALKPATAMPKMSTWTSAWRPQATGEKKWV